MCKARATLFPNKTIEEVTTIVDSIKNNFISVNYERYVS